jgi:hypothetical protein
MLETDPGPDGLLSLRLGDSGDALHVPAGALGLRPPRASMSGLWCGYSRPPAGIHHQRQSAAAAEVHEPGSNPGS